MSFLFVFVFVLICLLFVACCLFVCLCLSCVSDLFRFEQSLRRPGFVFLSAVELSVGGLIVCRVCTYPEHKTQVIYFT